MWISKWMLITYNFPKKGIGFTDLLIKNGNENKYIKEIIIEEKSPTEEIYKNLQYSKT